MCGDSLRELALILERITEVGIGLGIVRLDADRLAICSDRLVKLALVFEHYAEVRTGLDMVWLRR